MNSNVQKPSNNKNNNNNNNQNKKRKNNRRKKNPQVKMNAMNAVAKDMKRMQIKADQPLHLHVGTNEQDHFNKVIGSVEDSVVKHYLMSLVDPKTNQCRVPDAFNRETALVRSITVIDVPIRMDSTTNSGRFSCLIQPHLGALNDISNYAVALVNGNSTWPSNFADSGSYEDIVGNFDVRLDPNYTMLTQPAAAFSGFEGVTAGMINTLPFGTSKTVLSGYGLDIEYNGTTGRMYAPPGMYIVTLKSQCSAGGAWTVSAGGGAQLSVLADVVSGATGNGISQTLLVSYASSDSYILPNVTSNISTSNPSIAVFATTFDDNAFLATANRGVITQYRPVALSCLASYHGTLLNNGGTIASAFVAGGTDDTSYFARVPPSNTGSLQLWENLAKVPGSHNNELKSGAYCWWNPESSEDLILKTPDDIVNQAFPSLIVSGQYQPGTAYTTPATVTGIVRLEICRTVEFETTTTLFEKKRCIGSQMEIDAANMILAEQPHAMMNATHRNFIAKVFDGVKKGLEWGWKNKAPLLDIAKAIGPLLI